MKKIKPISLLLVLAVVSTAFASTADVTVGEPNVTVGEGEIRLDGIVRLVHPARGSFILEVTSYTLSTGRSQQLMAPRPKLILVSAQTVLNINGTAINGEASAKAGLDELKAGSRVAAVGTDWGRGKELPAHSVTVLKDLAPAPGSAATDSTAGAGISSVSSAATGIGEVALDSQSQAMPSLQLPSPPRISAPTEDKWKLWQIAYERSQALRTAQNKVRYSYFSGGSSREKIVALTFDDGPDAQHTAKILDILKREKVPATFFVIGSKAEKYPELVLRQAAEGHDVGNHTYHHFQVKNLDAQDWRFEIERTNEVLAKILGGPPRWFRAPGCHYTVESLKVLRDLKMVRVDTTANSGDSNGHKSVSAILDRTLANLKPGAVILCHDRIPNTVIALPKLIHAIRKRGYRFVSLSHLALRAQATPGFQPVFWPRNQGITIEGQRAPGR